ncbi:MAG: DUF4340 domain-containing protein [Alphaproteobacteria bacterium]|nr:DUF4340 domain-containing protein [Alphaproteobacteria bacterium]
MNKRLLLKAFLLFIISGLFAAFSFLWLNSRQPASRLGQLVFANAVNYDKSVDKITISTTKETFDLVLTNNYWHINGAEGYYAGLMLVNDLLSAMTQSVYYSKQPATPELLKQYGLELKSAGQGMSDIASVKIYSQNVLLNEINLGLRSENGLYTYAHIPGTKDIWLISGSFTLPQYRYSWYQQPLFSYPESAVKTVASLKNGSKSLLMRLNNKQDFVNKDLKSVSIPAFWDELKYVIFEDVKPVKDFDFNQYPQSRKIRLGTFSGLTNELMIYTNGQKYWLTTKLSAASLTTGKFKDYIASYELLTAGWIFELPDAGGEILYTTEF